MMLNLRHAILFVLVVSAPAATTIACDGNDLLDFDEGSWDECRSNDDCGRDERCAALLFGKGCIRPCTSDDDCPADQACSLPNYFGPNHCVHGCRTHEDCPPDEICSGVQCTPGCRAHEDCPIGFRCNGGTCETGCREDEGCGDRVCDRPFPGGSEYSCVAIPEPLACGDQLCEPIRSPSGIAPPCCTSEGSCGQDIGQSFAASLSIEACQPMRPKPAFDASCFMSCRAESGECGVDLSEIGVGCAERGTD